MRCRGSCRFGFLASGYSSGSWWISSHLSRRGGEACPVSILAHRRLVSGRAIAPYRRTRADPVMRLTPASRASRPRWRTRLATSLSALRPAARGKRLGLFILVIALEAAIVVGAGAANSESSASRLYLSGSRAVSPDLLATDRVVRWGFDPWYPARLDPSSGGSVLSLREMRQSLPLRAAVTRISSLDL